MEKTKAHNSRVKTATTGDLRYRFDKLESWLQADEEVEITKNGRVIARLVPVRPKLKEYPDFEARAREIFGDRITEMTGTQLLAEDRDRY